MKLDDPKLTAYALNELDGAERAEIEAILSNDTEARELVNEIRASADLLSAELKKESAGGLSADQRSALEARMLAAPLARRRAAFWKPLAVAASLLFVVGIVGPMMISHSPKRVAMQDDAMAITVQSPSSVSATEKKPNQFALDESPAAVFADSKGADDGRDIVIPPEIIAKAEWGDHFEVRQIQDIPDNPNQYRPISRESAGGGGVAGLNEPSHLEASKGSGGGWGGGKGEGIGVSASKKKISPKVAAQIPPPLTAPVATGPSKEQVPNGALETPIRSNDVPAPTSGQRNQPLDKFSNDGNPYAAAGSVQFDGYKIDSAALRQKLEKEQESARVAAAEEQRIKASIIKQQGAVVVVHDKKIVETKDQAEAEKLKQEIAELRVQMAKRKESEAAVAAIEKELDSKYGPNTESVLKDHVAGYRLEANGFKKLPEATEIPPGNIIPQPVPSPIPGTETYPAIAESGFKRVTDEPLSTFSMDVDTASYSNVRRYLNQGQLPPRDAVRIEEMLNYFSYNYGEPTGSDPFAIHVEIADCPWNTAHRLARVGIKGREFPENKRPAGNYVFLVDVSGSMDDPKRLPLIQSGLNMLVDKLGDSDRVGIVTYAGESGIPLTSTACTAKSDIKRVISGLKAAGSTNGGDGIQKAYKMAAENFIKGGINRVILCTDGDFNVGVTDPNELVKMIEAQSKTGVFLTILGVGMGNLKDATMEKLADKGNGNYAYIDSLDEVRKVLIDQMNATLATIAKDVKIQVEFNPAQAGAYRLIGYEKRALAKHDFNNDKVDAGEVGAGHQVTALYEIIPAAAVESEPGVDPLIYQKNPARPPAPGASADLMTLKIRYKQHDGDTSKLIKGAVSDAGASYSKASKDFKFAAAVAAFGMILRESPYRGNTTLEAVSELADDARGKDEGGYRREFLGLVEKAKAIIKK